MQQEQNDVYSQQQKPFQRKFKIRALNLSKQQLRDRIQALKNYSLWKRTKAKRINYKQLKGDQNSPIINTVASYGCRNGYNQVFAEYLRSEKDKLQNGEEKRQKYKSQDRNNHRPRNISKDNPSFISYKTAEKQKIKIYKMVTQGLLNPQIKKDKSLTTKRCITEFKLQNESNNFRILGILKRKVLNCPKQLVYLKRKLKNLPHLRSNRNEIELVKGNTQDDNPTMSLVSNQNEQTQSRRAEIIQRKCSSFRYQYPTNDNSHNRSVYLKCINNILDKSTELLNGNVKHSSIDTDCIRIRDNSFNSVVFNQRRSESEVLRAQVKQNHLTYWPKYSRYGISDVDNRKFQQILRKCSQINHQIPPQNEDVDQMMTLIKDQISLQQNQINEQVLQQQKNAFEHKFDYKINLQKEKYKKNMKQLLRCKKEYRIQKQRQEIRANGIKRMKKMGDMSFKMKKNAKRLQQQQEES